MLKNIVLWKVTACQKLLCVIDRLWWVKCIDVSWWNMSEPSCEDGSSAHLPRWGRGWRSACKMKPNCWKDSSKIWWVLSWHGDKDILGSTPSLQWSFIILKCWLFKTVSRVDLGTAGAGVCEWNLTLKLPRSEITQTVLIQKCALKNGCRQWDGDG